MCCDGSMIQCGKGSENFGTPLRHRFAVEEIIVVFLFIMIELEFKIIQPARSRKLYDKVLAHGAVSESGRCET